MATTHGRKWLRMEQLLGTQGPVDRKAGVIRGMIVAEEGVFRDSRGEFDGDSLSQIVTLMRAEPQGLKSRFTHPNLSDDGLGKYLGRVRDPRLQVAHRLDAKARTGGEVQLVRGDLHLDPTALREPVGGGKPLGEYVMDLAESDPEALGASLVLYVDQEVRTDARGRPLRDESGEELPPLWRPTELHAVDVVDTGDATRSFLAAGLDLDGLPDAVVREATELLDRQFAGKDRALVEERLLGFVGRYLDWQFGPVVRDPARDPAEIRKRLMAMTG
jgi:hypothetical protein